MQLRLSFPYPLVLATLWLSFAANAAPLNWQAKDGYRVAKVQVAASGKTGFTLLTPVQTGIVFTNQLGYERSEANQNLLNGAGLAAGDYDGDGWCDLYFCNLEGANALFRNLGNWKFENVTTVAGVGCTNQTSRGTVFADVNGDGRLDLLVTSLSGPNAYLLNEGNGKFRDVTQAAGLVISKAGGHSMALADVDGDGDLDLYVANYGENSILRSGGAISVRKFGTKSVVTGRHGTRVKIINGQFVEIGEPDFLFLNDGKGNFSAVPWNSGIFLNEEGQPLKSAPWDMGLSAMFRDMNGDGAPDLYVCNDFQTPDRIWINNGRGQFRLIDPDAIRSTCHFSMGVDFADLDRDGRDEFFVSDMLSRNQKLRMRQMGATNPPPEQVGEMIDRQQIRRNTLYWNRGDGTYAEIANYAGLDASDWSWSVVFLDVDLDGYEDLLVSNGHAYDTQDLDMHERASTMTTTAGGATIPVKHLRDYPSLETPNVLFRNRHDLTFEEVGAQWGFNSTNVSHGISLADLDNDGDLDIVVSCLWKAPLIYRNESSEPRVAVRLNGKAPNTQGIGAKIKVIGGAVPTQAQEIISGGRYLSGDDPMRVFAAGSLTNRLMIEVTWRNGTRSVVRDAQPNCIYEIDENGARPFAPQKPTATPVLFTNVSALLKHTHEDMLFNDMERQPLLPKLLSQAGPGVAWYDLDQDGHEDLIIPAGTGGRTALFHNDAHGGFTRWPVELSMTTNVDDELGVVGAVLSPNKRSLVIAQANYEHPGTNAALLRRYDFGSEKSNPQPVVSSAGISAGAVAVADFDGDGDLDVFVGGRALPGRYPEGSISQWYTNVNGRLELEAKQNLGIVNGAVFSDLNGDGVPELIVACEWGPVRVFQRDAGKPRDITADLGLQEFVGWWNGVTTGDLDGDGRLDIIAANWGLNSSSHQPSAKAPVALYYGDFDANGSVDLVEAIADSGRLFQRHDMRLLARGLPTIRERFRSHREYSEADLVGVMGDWLPNAKEVRATTLASMVFLNRGDRFLPVLMPRETQWAPAFGVNVADFDGDGMEDVFLSQNFFAMRPEEPRLDSGRALLLRGQGDGKLATVPGSESGIVVYGEQRGSAVADFDEDGRTDLVVTQNRSTTQLLRNEEGKPGLRVRLRGPSGNPDAIGAVLRLHFGERKGPAREIHAGSGYLSQDSAIQVMGTPQAPTAITVRWPGGATTTSELSRAAEEVAISAEGKLQVLR